MINNVDEIVEMNPNNLVTKSNLLIEANYKLGVIEQKIILCLASNIGPDDSDFKTYTLPIKDFNKTLGLKGTPKYTELKQITRELMRKVFEVQIDKKTIQVSWLSYVAYNESEGEIEIRFDPFLRPYLLELKREFTSYKLENVVKLKSSYSIRIYELLKQYEKLKERTFQLDSLREMLGVEDVYPVYGNFKQRVLVPAQKELKNKTDISFEFDEIKRGRKVGSIKFNIFSTKNPKPAKLGLLDEDEPLGENKQPNAFIERVKKLGLQLGIQLQDEMITSWGKYGQDTVLDLLKAMQDRKDIKNPVGYIIKVLSSPGAKEAAAFSENSRILAYLVADFRKSRDPLPNWMIKQNSISMIEQKLNIDHEQALEVFEDIKKDLYEILDIEDQDSKVVKISEEEKKRIWESVKQLSK